jgi:hypothetical protein
LYNPGRSLLAKAGTMRNAILHSNYKQTRKTLKKARYAVGKQRIKGIKLPTEGGGAIQALMDTLKTGKGMRDFDVNSQVEGNRFPHQLQAAYDGTFVAAEQMLKDCNTLLDRALDAYHAEQIAKSNEGVE